MTMQAKKTTKPTGADGNEQFEAAVKAGRQTLENTMQASSEAAARGLEQTVGMTARQVEALFKVGTDAFKGYEDVVGFGKKNIDAVMQSSAILAQGFQEINAAWFGLAQSSMDESVAATKAILGSKNIGDAVKVPMDLAKTNYEHIVGETRKISELSMKVAEKAAGPIANQVNAAVERFTKPLTV